MVTNINTKDEFDHFLDLIVDKELSVENQVMSDEAENVLDTLMIDYIGRLSLEDLKIVKKAFSSEKVEMGGDYVAVRLPEEKHDPQDSRSKGI